MIDELSNENSTLILNNHALEITENWKLLNNKIFKDSIQPYQDLIDKIYIRLKNINESFHEKQINKLNVSLIEWKRNEEILTHFKNTKDKSILNKVSKAILSQNQQKSSINKSVDLFSNDLANQNLWVSFIPIECKFTMAASNVIK